jgi:hypothetical protein
MFKNIRCDGIHFILRVAGVTGIHVDKVPWLTQKKHLNHDTTDFGDSGHWRLWVKALEIYKCLLLENEKLY